MDRRRGRGSLPRGGALSPDPGPRTRGTRPRLAVPRGPARGTAVEGTPGPVSRATQGHSIRSLRHLQRDVGHLRAPAGCAAAGRDTGGPSGRRTAPLPMCLVRPSLLGRLAHGRPTGPDPSLERTGARVTRLYGELSGESLELARAEVGAVAEVLGGAELSFVPSPVPLAVVELARDRIATLAERLALARRCLTEVESGGRFSSTAEGPYAAGQTAAFRRLGSPSGGPDVRGIDAAARSWKAAGGTIDLEHPDRRFWWVERAPGVDLLLEEVAAVDRPRTSARRISALPFRRPIGLAPRLARAAANLARIAPGDRVVDPFLGTGALLAEA